MKKQTRRVAIVCDWLTGIGGAERVVLELHHLYPEAPIFTSQYDPLRMPWFKDADVRTTWLQSLPKGSRKFLPPLRRRAFERLDLQDYDLILSSSGAEAKAVRKRPDALHICYCHAPTHYYWDRYNDYVQHPGFGALDPMARLGLKTLVEPMRKWDKKAAQQPDILIANSKFTQQKIKEYYERDSVVIHPPVEVKRFKPTEALIRSGLVVAGRQTPYKRIDLAVAACTELKLPLTVIGGGPDHAKLKTMAGPTVTFLGAVADEDMPRFFSKAGGFIFPGTDDFGIVAVEALAAGTPVIAYKNGGALDYIKPGKNGLFFSEPTADSLMSTLKIFQTKRFDHSQVAKSAQKFAPERFRRELRALINTSLENRK